MTGPYQLLDFGDGRKLESIAGFTIIRPSPAAIARPMRSWPRPDAVFDASARRWVFHRQWPEEHFVTVPLGGPLAPMRMPVRPTPYGHIGVFPEQQDNWRWLAADDGVQKQALNLFGYTGGSTIALARSAASVVHVDAAKPNVESAKIAAAENDLSDHPIRFMVDDAAKFVARELRRQRQYDVIVMDPPAYGHGPRRSRGGGRSWRIERDLWPLLGDCLSLMRRGGRLLMTGHTDGVGHREVKQFLLEQGPQIRADIRWQDCVYDAGRATLTSREQRRLDAGFYLRVQLPLN